MNKEKNIKGIMVHSPLFTRVLKYKKETIDILQVVYGEDLWIYKYQGYINIKYIGMKKSKHKYYCEAFKLYYELLNVLGLE